MSTPVMDERADGCPVCRARVYYRVIDYDFAGTLVNPDGSTHGHREKVEPWVKKIADAAAERRRQERF